MRMDDDSLLQAPRGTRDFKPAEAGLRLAISEKLRCVFERYGFVPLETPVLEKMEVLSSKYAGGSEILKETYQLEDQGGRKLGLRYDLTVPLCRVVAGDASLPKPFKRYQIAPVFRDGPLKTGRYREFVQCDVDTIGAGGMIADAEILALVADAFNELGFKVVIKVNNRKFLNGLLDAAGVPENKRMNAILSLDKLEKIGVKGVTGELKEKGLSKQAGALLSLVAEKDVKILEKKVASAEGKEGLAELNELFDYLKAFGVKNFEFVPSLARGLAYYTGTVFEVYLVDSKLSSSVAAGGRYDDLVGLFAGSKDKVPAVGISFGLDVLFEAFKEAGKADASASTVRVFVIPFKETVKEAAGVCAELRKAGVNAAMDLMGRGVSKNIDFASKQGIPFVVFVGKQELEQGKVKLRDLKTGNEELVSVAQAVKLLKTSLFF
ncbi:MAG: histidine--tRNA ligase [Candidatus Micrarchaeota archaeon]